MAESNDPVDAEGVEPEEAAAADEVAEETDDIEDVEMEDEEISERIRGGVGWMSVPF